jgi:hypothetical protein
MLKLPGARQFHCTEKEKVAVQTLIIVNHAKRTKQPASACAHRPRSDDFAVPNLLDARFEK